MDKIDMPGFFNPGTYSAVRAETQKTKDKSPARKAKKTGFSRLMDDVTPGEPGEIDSLPAYSPSEETLRGLLDDVHSAGDALKQRPLAEEIKQYKSAVRHFLHYVVENGYTLESHAGIPKFLKPEFQGGRKALDSQERKRYTLVQVVDQKLEELASAVLSGQSSQVELLTRLDEIKGLLVDLMQ